MKNENKRRFKKKLQKKPANIQSSQEEKLMNVAFHLKFQKINYP